MRSEIMDGILRHIHPSGGIENAKLLEVSPGHAKLSRGNYSESLKSLRKCSRRFFILPLRHGGRNVYLRLRDRQCHGMQQHQFLKRG